MNENLIESWNSRVTNKDDIYLAGDFAFKAFPSEGYIELPTLFARLRGRKHLVIGNHDEKNPQAIKGLSWTSTSDIATVKFFGMRAMVCHYPMETWKGSYGGALMIHGHTHGNLKRIIPHRFDVGCDVWPSPVSFEELWNIAKDQKFDPTDGDGVRSDGEGGDD
jgi:calcineurin-like phosphoesterase family protein